MGLIGRDDVLVRNVAKAAQAPLRTSHNYSELRPIDRGYEFDLELLERDDKPTGHVVKVQVTLACFEDPRGPSGGS